MILTYGPAAYPTTPSTNRHSACAYLDVCMCVCLKNVHVPMEKTQMTYD